MTIKQSTPLSTGLNLKVLGTNDSPNLVQQVLGAPLILSYIAVGVAANEVYQFNIINDIKISTLFLLISASVTGSSTLRIVIRNTSNVNAWDFTVSLNGLTKLGNLYYLTFPDGTYLRDNYQLFCTPNIAIDSLQFNASYAYLEPDNIGNKVSVIPTSG